ncbi:uncharacterized protein CLUP02_10317 [Colletotrichum lupini]|uniref:Uncharacterized protein n=1 Tax=Colletotrichum lupini TaxID=145971 RepID=A0A9Q8SY27_9PEZI|nr:uncharacterized protein CLUP02_10317 [Colletotrichum lupini]UQC84821.1 hypothetical protein CLUP02_10317 [Colletotrichum lupini]
MGTPSTNLLFAAYCKVPTLPSSVLGEYRDQLDQGSKVPRKRCTVRTTVDPPSTLHTRHFPSFHHLASRYEVLPTNQTTPEPELTHLHRLTHSPRLDNTICGISLPPSPSSDIGRGSHPDDPDGCNCRLQSIICCLPPQCLVKQASYAVATQLGSGSPSSMGHGSWTVDHGCRPSSINVVRQYNRVRASQPDNPPVVRYEPARHDTDNPILDKLDLLNPASYKPPVKLQFAWYGSTILFVPSTSHRPSSGTFGIRIPYNFGPAARTSVGPCSSTPRQKHHDCRLSPPRQRDDIITGELIAPEGRQRGPVCSLPNPRCVSNIVPAAPACLRTEYSQAEAKSSGPCDIFGGRHNGGILLSTRKFRILRHWIRNFETDNENVRIFVLAFASRSRLRERYLWNRGLGAITSNLRISTCRSPAESAQAFSNAVPGTTVHHRIARRAHTLPRPLGNAGHILVSGGPTATPRGEDGRRRHSRSHTYRALTLRCACSGSPQDGISCVLLALHKFGFGLSPADSPIGYTERGKHISQFASTMPAHLILVCHAAALDANLGHCSQSAPAAVKEATLRAAKPSSKSFLI